LATLDLRWFTNEESLRSIAPVNLLRLLMPHAAYFKSRGIALPVPESGQLPDYGAVKTSCSISIARRRLS
jgi:hypothetical protein